MPVACWITMATDTHSEYIILVSFPLQLRFRERASMLRLYVHCLSLFYFNERKNLGEISTVSFSLVVYLSHIQNIILLNYNVKLHLIYTSLRKPVYICFIHKCGVVLNLWALYLPLSLKEIPLYCI
jgi:hypothetical protein